MLGGIYAFRLGPAVAAAPEDVPLGVFLLGIVTTALIRFRFSPKLRGSRSP